MFKSLMLGAVVLLAGVAYADDAKVAVAANFTAPANEIAVRFKAATGDTVTPVFGASGQFATQIASGAPFDVFLSADIDHAKKVEDAGLSVAGSRFTYATGHLVLWSADPKLVDGEGKVLTSGSFTHVAIADPALAPYGLAAEQYLKGQGLWAAIAPKLVTGKSIAQAYEFVKSGNAELGFVALSQVVGAPGGSEWEVPDADHAPITQQAVLLKHGAADKAATEFLEFLKGSEAQAIIKKYGYN